VRQAVVVVAPAAPVVGVVVRGGGAGGGEDPIQRLVELLLLLPRVLASWIQGRRRGRRLRHCGPLFTSAAGTDKHDWRGGAGRFIREVLVWRCLFVCWGRGGGRRHLDGRGTTSLAQPCSTYYRFKKLVSTAEIKDGVKI
jgi:hypothetical protein